MNKKKGGKNFRKNSAMIVDRIIRLLDKGALQQAVDVKTRNLKNLHSVDIAKSSKLFREKTNQINQEIQQYLEGYRFNEADLVFIRNKFLLNEKEYKKKKMVFEDAYHRQNEIFIQSILNKIHEALTSEDITQVEKQYKEIKDLYSREEFDRLVIRCRIENGLRNHRFQLADELQTKFSIYPHNEYLQEKARHIINFFDSTQNLSEEQALVLATSTNNFLIKARAGSGKTRTLASKVKFLADRYDINPDQILVLAFNKKAATEIKHRIKQDLAVRTFENARTFHSLAYQIVNPETNILFDNGEQDLSPKELSEFVRAVLRSIWDSSFRSKLVAAFRKEFESLKRAKSLLNQKEYYSYVRNARDVSLGGQHVKSKGEKFIADFLFEHDISFEYEKIEFWNGRPYRPDFTIYKNGQTYIIEHWGIDPYDPNSKPPEWWKLSRKEYCQEIEEKRSFWQNKEVDLIETSIADLRQDRNNFEAILNKKLEESGISCKRMPQKELENRVVYRQKDRMTRLFVQFIQKAKKRKWSPKDVKAKARKHQPLDEREQVFLELSLRVYEAYQDCLDRASKLDFDQLLIDAVCKIRLSKGSCPINLGRQKRREIAIKDVQWILVDEYQDLSFLFFDLLQAIREANPSVRLLCVGDDWQAINGFAGSDLKFMNDFENLFPKSQTNYLLTNFRSEQQIVASGNALMAGLGKPGKHLPHKNKGKVSLRNIDKIYIEGRRAPAYQEQWEKDSKFRFDVHDKNGKKLKDNGFAQAKYLKACYEIITEPDNFKRITKIRGKKGNLSVAILSRTNILYRITLKDFYYKLRSLFTEEELDAIGEFSNKIRIGTVHSFKGLEAEIVIVLRTTQGAFPLVHPDTYLFRLFGETDVFGLQEERRLFYVALTRASWKTYLLTESGNESEYFDDIFGSKNSRQ